MVALVSDQLKQAQMHTPAQRRVHTHSVSHTNVHKSEKKNVVSQINTGKVRYAHGIYPSSFNKNKGRDHAGSNGKVCRSLLLYCSFTPIADYKTKKKMKREKKWGGGERQREERQRGPCPEQLKPPGQPRESDSQHHRLQGASSSGKPSSDPPSVSCGPVGEEVLGRGWVVGGRIGGQQAYLLQAYRACVLSSMGSPLVSCCPSASGGRVPFSVASLSDRPRIRGNSMKSYSRAPMAPPIMGPTQ